MTNARWAILAMALTATFAAPAFADEALATSKNCMSCHKVDKKLVPVIGVNLKRVDATKVGSID